MTARDGRVFKLENVFLRGGNIKFIILPDVLKHAPVLRKIQGLKAKAETSSGDKGGKAAGGGGTGGGGMGPGSKRPRQG